MFYKSLNWIEETTSNIIKTLDIKIPIEDMEEVVNKLNGKVIEDDSLELANMGLISNDKDSGYSFKITLPVLRDKIERNYRIAYCLGKLFLFTTFKLNEPSFTLLKNERETNTSKKLEEKQAITFANSLLMPKVDFYRYIFSNVDNNNCINTDTIARVFKVKHINVESRIYDMNIEDKRKQ